MSGLEPSGRSPSRVLSRQRCFHHGAREAVACCPACGRFFCRECVTEHDDRLLCAACLKTATPRHATEGRAVRRFLYTLQVAAGLVVTWLFFYATGQVLLRIPSSFHEGTVWKGTWLDNP